MIVEEFKNCVHEDIKVHIEEKEVQTIDEATKIADTYSLVHKRNFSIEPPVK